MSTHIMDAIGMDRALMRIAHEIIEKNESTENLCVVGILRRGALLAGQIAENLKKLGASVNLGTLAGFDHIGKTILDYLGVPGDIGGESFSEVINE